MIRIASRSWFLFLVLNVLMLLAPASQGELLKNGLNKPYPAPDVYSGKWINQSELKGANDNALIQSPNNQGVSIKELKGKVVLVYFWTYSCINCIRTLPHINNLYEKYHDLGLIIIGVHSPEFPAERKYENLLDAVHKHDIKYPVVQDNEFKTWSDYHNRYWPAQYLINKKGEVVYTHFGEGEYSNMDENIRLLISVNDKYHDKSTPKYNGKIAG